MRIHFPSRGLSSSSTARGCVSRSVVPAAFTPNGIGVPGRRPASVTVAFARMVPARDLRGGDRSALAGLLKKNPLKYLSEGAESKHFGRKGNEFFIRPAWPA